MKNKTIGVTLSSLILAVVIAATSFSALAGSAPEGNGRKEWKTELRNYKHRFLKKELGLTREQETAFYKVYDEMDEQLMKINEETRALEKKVVADKSATDTELEAAARAIFEQRKKESEIELKYFDQLTEVLTLKQLVKLKYAERKLAMTLIPRHKGH